MWLTLFTGLNCAGGSSRSTTIHGCFLTCARGVSCIHSASSYQTGSQAYSPAACVAQSLAALHLPCVLLPSKSFHSGTSVVGSSLCCVDSESGCISRWEPPHPAWHLCSASGLPIKSTHCHHHGCPRTNPFTSHDPITNATAAKRTCHGSKCNFSSKVSKKQCFLPFWLNQIISYQPDTS